MPSYCVHTWPLPYVWNSKISCVCSPSYKDTGPTGLGPTLWAYLNLMTSIRALSPNTVTLRVRDWTWEFLGNTVHSITETIYWYLFSLYNCNSSLLVKIVYYWAVFLIGKILQRMGEFILNEYMPLKKNLFIFNWRIIALQYCVGFCQTSIWVNHKYTYVTPFLFFWFNL